MRYQKRNIKWLTPFLGAKLAIFARRLEGKEIPIEGLSLITNYGG